MLPPPLPSRTFGLRTFIRREGRVWLLALWAVLGTWDASPQAAEGETAFAFLEIGSDARSAGLAEAYTALADDVHTLYGNPAGLGALPVQSLHTSYLYYLMDIQAGTLSFAGPFENGGWGIGVTYMNYGPIPADTGSEPVGAEIPTDHPYNLSLVLGYGFRLWDNLWLGANLKGVNERLLEYTSQGVGADLGVLYCPAFLPPVRFGACLKNFGFQTKAFIEARRPFPASVNAGLAGGFFEDTVGVAVDVGYRLSTADLDYAVGAEYTWNQLFRLRAGYRSSGQDLNGGSGGDLLNGLCFGFGLEESGYRLDYAFVPFHSLGQAHRVSLVWSWGEIVPASPPRGPLAKPKTEPSSGAPRLSPAAASRPPLARTPSVKKSKMKKKARQKKSKHRKKKKPKPVSRPRDGNIPAARTPGAPLGPGAAIPAEPANSACYLKNIVSKFFFGKSESELDDRGPA